MPIVVVTGHADAATCRAALQSGVFDFVEKSFNSHELVRVIQQALRHNESNQRVSRIKDAFHAALATLSPREREVMELLASGRSWKEVGQQLGISVQTASKHWVKLFDKLDVSNEVDLFKLLATVESNRATPAALTQVAAPIANGI